jgi:5'-3' exonuclease
VHLSELKGLTVGVDAYCWLHRGAFACSTELCQGVETDKHVRFCMRRLELLLSNGIVPWVVFDGAALPMKDGVCLKRRQQRAENLEKAEAALLAEEHVAARQHFAKAVSITHVVAREFIKALAKKGVKYLVAPYEADAQLAYLSQQGLVDAVLTEDSDSLPYCCKRVLFKLDNDGTAQEVRFRELTANQSPSLEGWTHSMFLDWCLLSGCDYLPSVHGLGIVTAHKLVARHRAHRPILAYLRSSRTYSLPEGYEERYEQARLCFRHQTVYDPRSGCTVPLMPLSTAASEHSDNSFLGPLLEPAVAQGVATSMLDPYKHQEYAEPLLVVKPAATATANKANGSSRVAAGGASVPTTANRSTNAAAASSRADGTGTAAAGAMHAANRRGSEVQRVSLQAAISRSETDEVTGVTSSRTTVVATAAVRAAQPQLTQQSKLILHRPFAAGFYTDHSSLAAASQSRSALFQQSVTSSSRHAHSDSSKAMQHLHAASNAATACDRPCHDANSSHQQQQQQQHEHQQQQHEYQQQQQQQQLQHRRHGSGSSSIWGADDEPSVQTTAVINENQRQQQQQQQQQQPQQQQQQQEPDKGIKRQQLFGFGLPQPLAAAASVHVRRQPRQSSPTHDGSTSIAAGALPQGLEAAMAQHRALQERASRGNRQSHRQQLLSPSGSVHSGHSSEQHTSMLQQQQQLAQVQGGTCIPLAAQHFACTTVSDTLMTVQRRRRIREGTDGITDGCGGGDTAKHDALQWLWDTRAAEGGVSSWERTALGDDATAAVGNNSAAAAGATAAHNSARHSTADTVLSGHSNRSATACSSIAPAIAPPWSAGASTQAHAQYSYRHDDDANRDNSSELPLEQQQHVASMLQQTSLAPQGLQRFKRDVAAIQLSPRLSQQSRTLNRAYTEPAYMHSSPTAAATTTANTDYASGSGTGLWSGQLHRASTMQPAANSSNITGRSGSSSNSMWDWPEKHSANGYNNSGVYECRRGTTTTTADMQGSSLMRYLDDSPNEFGSSAATTAAMQESNIGLKRSRAEQRWDAKLDNSSSKSWC